MVAAPEELFADDFESGDLATEGWTTANGNASAKTSAASTGAWGAELKRSDFDGAGAQHGGLRIDRSLPTRARLSGLDNGETLTVEWSGTGGAGGTIESTQITSYSSETFQLPAVPLTMPAFKLIFTTNANRNNEKARIDDVQITGVPSAPPTAPGQATSPSPAIAAPDVSTSALLSWTAGSGSTSHDVYFGTNPSPGAGENMGNQAGTSFDPGTLELLEDLLLARR